MSEAIEITTFRLTKGVSCADFIAANADVDSWLAVQPGFRSRRIAERDDAYIVDMLIWASKAEAVSAMQRLMAELADSPVHGAIDQRTVTWTASTVVHTVGVR